MFVKAEQTCKTLGDFTGTMASQYPRARSVRFRLRRAMVAHHGCVGARQRFASLAPFSAEQLRHEQWH
jgi:hypothetical protein